MPKTMPVPRTNLVVLESGEPGLSAKPPVPERQTSQIGDTVKREKVVSQFICETPTQTSTEESTSFEAYLKETSPCFAKNVTLAVQAEIDHSFESDTTSFPPSPPPLSSTITK